jgi:hypothetical protein
MQNQLDKSIKKIAPVAVSAFAALILVGAASNQAFATASFDPDCGLTPSKSQGACGWVGKGDVQNAFDPTWNNAQLQQRASAVDFTYVATTTSEVTIQYTTDNPSKVDEGANCEPISPPPTNPNAPQYICTETHTVTQEKTTSIDATVNADPRQSPKQFTGFLLTAATITTSGDTIPNVGDSCPNGPNGDCVVTAVAEGSTEGNFYAVWNSPNGIVTSNPIAVSIV